MYRIPYYEDIAGVGPCGSIVSNIEDMSRWLIALMNDGKYAGKQVLPAEVLKETLGPAIALPNTALETRGWTEVLNATMEWGVKPLPTAATCSHSTAAICRASIPRFRSCRRITLA